jgi:hypothetical protein
LTVNIINTGWQVWTNPSIDNIPVTTGKCVIGLRVVSTGGSWAFVDDVGLSKNK